VARPEESPAPLNSHKKIDFFISYNKADRAWAEWIAWQLFNTGYTVKLQAWHFRPGNNFVVEMHQAAIEAERTIAVLSPSYLTSRFTHAEWAAAFVQDPTGKLKLLLPIRVRECKPEGLLAAITYQDLVGLNELDARVTLLAGLSRNAAIPESPPPYPGEADQPRGAAPRFPGRLPPVWNVPHLRNPLFMGRDEILAALESDSELGRAAVRVRFQAIHGLGGIGKTQLAVEAAYRNSTDYDVVWWLRSEDSATLTADYMQLGSALGVPEPEPPNQTNAIEAIRRRLEQMHERWLLIFDNASQPADVLSYFPRGGDGNVLVTSINPEWTGTAEPLPLGVYSDLEAVEYLLTRTGQADGESATALAGELGNLPLALAQAGAYATSTGMSIARYLDLFRERHDELLLRGNLDPVYPHTVATTWDLSFKLVESESSMARDLLILCAFLAPDAIPLNLLLSQLDEVPEPIAYAARTVLALEDAKALLRRLSLVEFIDDNALSVHRLVQMVTRDRLTEEERRGWVEIAIATMVSAFPTEIADERVWSTCNLLLPHALAAIEHGMALSRDTSKTGQLSFSLGQYLWIRGRLTESRNFLELAVKETESDFGLENPTTAVRVRGLAYALRDLGDLPSARVRAEQALLIDEKIRRANSADVAEDLAILGTILRQQGHLDDARKAHQRALGIHKKLMGERHSTVASDLNNLATVLRDLGELSDARLLLEQALSIHEENLDINQREIATDLGNLGHVLTDLDEYAAARSSLLRALDINRRIFGPDHPRVSVSLSLLAGMLRETGKLKSACVLLKRSLRIIRRIFGPKHSDFGTELNNLGHVLLRMRDLPEAKRCFSQALEIHEAILGSNHWVVSTDLNNLANVLIDEGDLTSARDLLLRAVTIARDTLPSDHPKLAGNLLNLAWVQNELGDIAEASEQTKGALAIWQLRNERDPRDAGLHSEAECLFMLGSLAVQAGRREAGLRLLATCLVIERTIKHPAAEAQVLPEVNKIAELLGYDKNGVQQLLSEVDVAFRRDRARGLVESVFLPRE
jgi:tetratricopeptide (TPR) repeat protein